MANSASRMLILQEAARRGWQTQTIGPNAEFLKVTHPDGRWELFRGPQPKRNSAVGQAVSKYKHITLDFIKTYGYSVPEYALVTTEAEAQAFLEKYGTMILKPADGQRSEGVTVNISEQSALSNAMAFALQHSNRGKVIAQQHCVGNLYRLLIVNGKMVAATWRSGLSVMGDGKSSVQQLIEELNTDTRRGESVHLPYKKIDIATTTSFLGEQTMASVPALNLEVSLAAMDSTPGGGAVNVTDSVHEDWQRFAVHIAGELGLFVCGFDFVCPDITQPIQDNYVPVLEVNATPGLRMHEFPTEGQPVHVIPIIFDALFPNG